MRIFSNYSSRQGFTLIELMMVIAVAAVLFGIALPSFSAVLERQRLISTQHSLMGGFHFARSLAIHERHQAVICPSADGLSCRNGGVWDQGWLVFVDRNRNGRRDADETVARVEQIERAELQIRSSRSRPRAVFRPNGGSGGSNLSLQLCALDGRLLGSLVLNNTGRLRKAEAPAAGARCS